MSVSALLAATPREQSEYLRRVFLASPANRDRVDQLLELPELYRNLVILELACLAPGLLVRALDTVAALGCLACPHERHAPGDCLVALAEDGPGYCTCGVPV